MSLEREYNRKFLSEMATIGVCDGKKVVTNALDHGRPHIHYGQVKIYLPKELPKNQTELSAYVDNAHRGKISEQDLTKLVLWFKDKSRIDSSFNNLKASWIAWNLEHPEEN